MSKKIDMSKELKETVERRVFTHVELRANDDNGALSISGYAAVFDKPSDGLYFVEFIQKGAFKETIKEDDVVGLFNHDSNLVLGRNSSDTLELKEDNKGLWFNLDLPDTQAAKDLYKLVDRGDVKGSSFSFSTLKDLWESDEKGENVKRTLIRVKLYDISPATFPAYPDTTVATRAMDRWLEQQKVADLPWRRELARRKLELAELN